MGKKSFLFGAIIGGTAAYVATLLVTPDSGKKVRESIDRKAQQMKNTFLDYTDFATEFSDEYGEKAKEKWEEVSEKAQDGFSTISEKIQNKFPQAQEPVFEADTDLLKRELSAAKSSLDEINQSSQEAQSNQDDIIVDAQSAFGEAKEAATQKAEEKLQENQKAAEEMPEVTDTDEKDKH